MTVPPAGNPQINRERKYEMGKKDLLVTVAKALLEKEVPMEDEFMAMIDSGKTEQPDN